jgi:probable HAF family extracellular repeat protein
MLKSMAAAVLVGGIVASSIAAPAHAAQPTRQYHGIRLDAPAGFRLFPNAVNDHRAVAVRLHNLAEGRDHPGVWHDGTLSQLALPTGYVWGDATDLNNSGVIVGDSIRTTPNNDVTISAVYWDAAGTVHTLPDIGGWENEATAVNEHGQIVGTITTATEQRHAALWTNGVLTDLGPGSAWDINERGQIAGTKSVNGVDHAVRWKADGTVTDLGAQVKGTSYGYGINAAGDVVGTSNDTPNGLTTVGRRWHNAKATKVDTGVHTWTSPRHINDHGMMVGSASSTKASAEPAVWINGKIADPTTLGIDIDGWISGLNNNGDLVGNGTDGGYLYV